MDKDKNALFSQEAPIVELIAQLYNNEIISKKRLIDFTKYDGITTWWLIDVLFYEFLKGLLGDRPPYRAKFKTSYIYVFMKLYKKLGPYVELCYDVFIKLLLELLFLKNVPEPNIRKVFFISQDRMWLKKASATNKTDIFFESIINYLRNEGVMCIGTFPIDLYPIKSLRILIEKKCGWDFKQKPVNYYWTPSVWLKVKHAHSFFTKSWKELSTSKTFTSPVFVRRNDVSDEIEQELELYFNLVLPHLVKFIEMERIMIRKETPCAFLLLNEFYFWERTLVMACKLEQVPTIAIQHGAIDPLHRGYRYFNNEVTSDFLNDRSKAPIPDLTAVYGPFYKHLLTKCSAYPEKNVIVTGSPRYDMLTKVEHIYSKAKFKEKYKIAEHKKIILWTTQCHDLGYGENIANFKYVFETLEKIQDVALIIKQHPSEPKFYETMIKQILDDYDIKAILTQHADVYELLFCCDLLISHHSTTVMEAILLKKPVIILNLCNTTDPIGYVREGVAVGVNESNDLKRVIKDLLNHEVNLDKAQQLFIKKYLYAADGRATERLVDALKTILGALGK